MPVTYTRTSAQVPTPIAAPTPTLGQPSTPFPTGQTYPPPGTSTVFNQLAQAAALVCENGGGGYGILTGGALSSAGSLNVQVGAGIFLGEGVLELVASSPVGSGPFKQVLIPNPYTLADNATNYVWLTRSGTLVSSTSTTYPAQAVWFLGMVTTAAGAITGVDASGVILVSGGRFTRVTADVGFPTDAPASGLTLYTQTTTGTYLWNGLNHEFQPLAPGVATLSATKTLTALDPTVWFFKTNGSNQDVKLPALTAIPTGRGYTIYNYDAAKNVVVKDSAGTLLCTLTPGQGISIPSFLNSAGSLVWPGTITPGTPAGGAPGSAGAGGSV